MSLEGETLGRGDEGSPIMRECLLPRSEVVIVTFNPLLAAVDEAFFEVGVAINSGAFMRMPWGLDEEDESTVTSPSVVSVPLSSWME